MQTASAEKMAEGVPARSPLPQELEAQHNSSPSSGSEDAETTPALRRGVSFAVPDDAPSRGGEFAPPLPAADCRPDTHKSHGCCSTCGSSGNKRERSKLQSVASIWDLSNLLNKSDSRDSQRSFRVSHDVVGRLDLEDMTSVEELVAADPQAAFSQNNMGMTLLHCVCSLFFERHLHTNDEGGAGVSLEELGDEIALLLAKNPAAARVRDKSDRTPLELLLHGCDIYACDFRDPTRRLLVTLVQLFCAETVEPPQFQLSCATLSAGTRMELLSDFAQLVTQFPAILSSSANSSTMGTGRQKDHAHVAGGMGLLAVAVVGHAPLPVLAFLMRADPEATKCLDDQDRSVLHHAAHHGRSGDVILSLLIGTPALLTDDDSSDLSAGDAVLSSQLPPAPPGMRRLVGGYAAAASHRDARGYTPLCDAATVSPFESLLHLFCFEASHGILDRAVIAHIDSHGFFAGLLDKLRTPTGVDMLAQSLVAAPDALGASLNIARMLRAQANADATRATEYLDVASGMQTVARELAFWLGTHIARYRRNAEDGGCEVDDDDGLVEELLQPNLHGTILSQDDGISVSGDLSRQALTAGALSSAIRLHDIQFISVPWIYDYLTSHVLFSGLLLHQPYRVTLPYVDSASLEDAIQRLLYASYNCWVVVERWLDADEAKSVFMQRAQGGRTINRIMKSEDIGTTGDFHTYLSCTQTTETLRVLVGSFAIPPPPKQRLWPSELFSTTYYLLCGVLIPQATFRVPFARHIFETVNYVAFVIIFSWGVVLEHWSTIGSEGNFGVRTHEYSARSTGTWNEIHIHYYSHDALPFACILFVTGALLKEWRQCRRLGSIMYFSDFWNCAELVSSAAVLIGLCLREGVIVEQDTDTARVVLAICTLLLWGRLLEIFRMSQLGPIVVVIIRMLHIVLQFFAIIALLSTGWAIALHSLLETSRTDNVDQGEAFLYRHLEWPYDFRTLWNTVRTLFRAFLGDFDFDLRGAEHQTAAEIILGSYLVMIIVLMLNLLIAVLSVKHAEVAEDMGREAAFTRAATILTLQDAVLDHELPPPFNVLQLPLRIPGHARSARERLAWLVWLFLTPLACLVSLVVVFPISLTCGLVHRLHQTGAELTWSRWVLCCGRYLIAWIAGIFVSLASIPLGIILWVLRLIAVVCKTTSVSMRVCILCCKRQTHPKSSITEGDLSEDLATAREEATAGTAPLAKFKNFVNGGQAWAGGRYRVIGDFVTVTSELEVPRAMRQSTLEPLVKGQILTIDYVDVTVSGQRRGRLETGGWVSMEELDVATPVPSTLSDPGSPTRPRSLSKPVLERIDARGEPLPSSPVSAPGRGARRRSLSGSELTPIIMAQAEQNSTLHNDSKDKSSSVSSRWDLAIISIVRAVWSHAGDGEQGEGSSAGDTLWMRMGQRAQLRWVSEHIASLNKSVSENEDRRAIEADTYESWHAKIEAQIADLTSVIDAKVGKAGTRKDS